MVINTGAPERMGGKEEEDEGWLLAEQRISELSTYSGHGRTAA